MKLSKLIGAAALMASITFPAMAIEGVSGYGTGSTESAARTAATNDLLNRYSDVRYIRIELSLFFCILRGNHRLKVEQVYPGKNKILTVVLMLLALVGQAMAPAAMACEMDMQSSATMMKMMNDMDHSMNQDADCCDEDCTCPIGSCTSFALIKSLNVAHTNITSQKIIQFLTQSLDQTPTSLYRPPILS
jgi:hypothetical protein